MEFVIVTGLSGAGKSSVMGVLEDIGFYCIDNLPTALIPVFADMCKKSEGKIMKVALAVDVRAGESFGELLSRLDSLSKTGLEHKILFVTASDETIIKRYKETRRKHPLEELTGGSMAEAINRERDMLQSVLGRADYVIDTSYFNYAQLKEYVMNIFSGGKRSTIMISVISFGFKYGLPAESDLVFNVQCLPNPYYIEELRSLTGIDEKVSSYVLDTDEGKELLKRMSDLLDFLLPLYIREGKSKLVISVGCTGGRHRSVAIAVKLAEILRQKNYFSIVNHRDINK